MNEVHPVQYTTQRVVAMMQCCSAEWHSARMCALCKQGLFGSTLYTQPHAMVLIMPLHMHLPAYAVNNDSGLPDA